MTAIATNPLAPADGGLVFHWLVGDAPQPLLQLAWSAGIIGGVFFGLVSVVAFIGIWAERKVAGRIQHRHGPNRVGPLGLLQSLADGIKLFSKEDLTPAGADRWLFRLAPYLTFAPVFAAFLVLPFGPDLTFEPRLGAGLFWVLAILGIEVIGVILAGWSSNNKWSVFGAMREACQLVSYEVPLGLTLLTVVLCAGTLDLRAIGWMQGRFDTWLVFRQPFIAAAFVLFFVAALASNKRAPFDLPESDSELVAGYHTEYSGLRFSLFYLAEYNGMFVMSAVMATIFLGAWHDPFGLIARHYAAATDRTTLVLLNVLAAHVFMAKCAVLMFIQMWVRWTLPRPRIDQVLHACVKVMIPLAGMLLVGSACWQWLVPPGSTAQRLTQYALAAGGAAVLGLLTYWLGSAFVLGRANRQRLSDPPAWAVR
jgi:NADH-quinone oxidoreductase subunit H